MISELSKCAQNSRSGAKLSPFWTPTQATLMRRCSTPVDQRRLSASKNKVCNLCQELVGHISLHTSWPFVHQLQLQTPELFTK